MEGDFAEVFEGDAPPAAVGRHKGGQLTIDQLAQIQPGLGQLMPQISDRYWIMYYAARAANWPLAHYQLRQMEHLFKIARTTQPKWAGFMTAFQETHLAAIEDSIRSQDWPAFETAYRRGVEAANAYHRATQHPEIEWRLPAEPPAHLEL